MNVLRYSIGPASGSPQSAEWTDPRSGLTRAATAEAPSVCLVRASDLPSLRALNDLVVDRKRKHPARALAKIMLGQSKPALLEGTYKCAGQMRRSFSTLLDHAKKRGERNLYIISVDDDLFDECWAATHRTAQAAQPPSDAPVEQPSSALDQPQATKGVNEPQKNGAAPGSRKPTADKPAKEDDFDWVPVPRYGPIPEELRAAYLGVSKPYETVHRLILHTGKRSAGVLIQGETGTGKEIVAQAIHRFGKRRNRPFVVVHCGSIPEELFEAELFGSAKGSYTGADRDKAGLFEEARDGSIFLDEIGDLPLRLQVKLLRVLESKRFRRVGENKERVMKAHVIAAAHGDLLDRVKAGEFRDDLYFRICPYVIHTPSLRDHPEDIRVMAQAFMKRYTNDPHYSLSEEVIRELQSYRWPGNVRELQHVLNRVYEYFGTKPLQVSDLQALLLLDKHEELLLPKAPKPRKTIARYLMNRLRHLQRTDRTIRACKVSARDVVYLGKDDAESVEALQASFIRYHDKLEGLCRRPLLFGSMDTFRVVHRLKALVGDFLWALSAHLGQALIEWRQKLRPQFKRTQAALFDEVDKLVALYV